MHDSKLFNLLRGIQHDELHWFQKFLHSPIYNTNKNPIRLYNYLKKHHPDFDSSKLTMERVFDRLFPNERFNRQKLTKIMYELAVLVEEFYVAMRLRNNSFERKKILVEELGERNIYDRFEKESKDLLKKLQSQNYNDSFFFENHFHLEKNLLEHPSTIRQEDAPNSFLELSQNLDNYYFLQKLHLACIIKSAEKIFSIKIKIPFINELIEEIKKREINEIPSLQLYLMVFQLFENMEKDVFFNALLKKYLALRKELSKVDNEAILKYLLNFALFKMNRGKEKYIGKSFQLYEIGLEYGILLKNNGMPTVTFGNIVATGAYLKKFEWTKNFIEQFQTYLDKKVRDEVVRFNLGKLHFQKGDFSTVIELLLNKTFSEVLYQITSRTILLKSYFEIFLKDRTYHDLILTQAEAFEKYLRREKNISKSNRTRSLNFIRYYKKLVGCFSKKTDLGLIQSSILKENMLSNKPWLLEKTKKV